jgi:HAD superfamily hydrolase (TIGR01509 family)
MFPATLFDYNGVLIDDEAVHFAAFAEVLRPLGVELSEEAYFSRYIGFDDALAFRAVLTDAGRAVTDELVRALVESKKPAYLERAQRQLQPFQGATELVQQRAAAGPVGIVSGALRHEIELGLDVLGVRSQVSFVVAAEDARASKPDPQGYLIGIERLRELIPEAAAARALVIEDTLAGVSAARAANLTCVAVAHSYSRDRLEQSEASAVVDSLTAVTPEFLTALFERDHG